LSEITLHNAKRIVDLHGWLANVRQSIRLLESASTARVVVKCVETNASGYKNTTELVLDCRSGTPPLRSVVDMMMRSYKLTEAGYVRELRQLGAEVPNG
jgi:hypothetical protein